ncbi:MAG: N-acetyltransferase family protein [Coriobacteriia bacterium]|nr:N-acetyltransferase family protein [Coriobacteriia bacterium]
MPQIRPAKPEDADAIARIYNQAVLHSTATFDQEPKSAEDRRKWLTSHGPRHPVLVLVEDGAVVGWGSLTQYSDRRAYDGTVEISTYIDEGFLGRRLGTALAQALIELAPSLGIHVILSRICTENTASLAMAARLGFTQVGVMHEVGRKFDRQLDVALLELIV